MQIFSELKVKLLPLIAAVRASPTPPDAAWLEGEYDVKTQAEFCDSLCKELGFDTKIGRLDVSVHPFTCGMFVSLVFFFSQGKAAKCKYLTTEISHALLRTLLFVSRLCIGRVSGENRCHHRYTDPI